MVLGVTSLIFRVKISKQTLNVNYPIMLVVSIIFTLILYFSKGLNHYTGYFFIVLLSSFIWFLIKNSRQENNLTVDEINEKKPSIFFNFFFIFLGVILLKCGADWLVGGTIYIAKIFNVSDRVIAVTVVAIGTSIPELVTSIIAALKKEENLAVGNLIGSNIFNILAVLGLTSTFYNLTVDDVKILYFDLPWMLGITIFLGVIIYITSKSEISRKEGFLMLVLYILYIIYSIIA